MIQNYTEVKNSNCIRALAYDQAKKTLFIKFVANDKQFNIAGSSPFYAYENVSAQVFEQLKTAENKGSFFHRIKKTLGAGQRLEN